MLKTLPASPTNTPLDSRPSAETVRTWAASIQRRLGLQSFDVFRSGNHLRLSSLEVAKGRRKQGLGSQAVQHLTEYADDNAMLITLDPGLRDTHRGTTLRSRLVRFYKRSGFVTKTGRNTDYRLSAGMYRVTKSTKTNQC